MTSPGLDTRHPGDAHVEVAVIGAGSAGLATAAALQRRGIRPIVLERGHGVGASWRDRHEELQLNTIRWLSDLPGLRLPREAGRWVSRDDYVSYLERFAEHHQLDVRCGTDVERAERFRFGWRLATSTGKIVSRHIVIATGNEQVPVRPQWPGLPTSKVPVRHVADQQRLADLSGRRVLVVGAGNSGIEVTGRLADVGVKELWLAVRRPPNILPREIAGVPLHPLTLASRALPERLRDAIAKQVTRATIGDLSHYGLPNPPDGPFRRLRTSGVTVAVDQGFVGHLRAGAVKIVPEIERFGTHDVVLRNGERLTPDLVLTATGFRPGFESLFIDADPTPGSPMRSPADPTSTTPGIWFIGFEPAIEGNLRQHPGEARRIARGIHRDLTGGRRNAAQQNATRTRQPVRDESSNGLVREGA